MTKFGNIGGFTPIDRLSSSHSPAIGSHPPNHKRPTRAEPALQSSPKRRKRELSPLTGPDRSRLTRESALTNRHDIQPQFSPTHKAANSLSNISGSGNKNSVVGVPELRQTTSQVFKSRRSRPKPSKDASDATKHPSRQPRHTPPENDSLVLSLDSESDVDVEALPAKVMPTPKNTRLSIILPTGGPSGRGKLRDRMLDHAPRQSISTTYSRLNATKSSLQTTGSGNDSVDELSTEFFPGKPPSKASKTIKTGIASPTCALVGQSAHPRLGPNSKKSLIPVIKSIIHESFHVVAAFCLPSYILSTKDTTADGPIIIKTSTEHPHIMLQTDNRDHLFWLKIDLKKVNSVKYSSSSPFVLFGIPHQVNHETILGPRMVFRFQSAKEAQQVLDWIRTSVHGKVISFKELHAPMLVKIFEQETASILSVAKKSTHNSGNFVSGDNTGCGSGAASLSGPVIHRSAAFPSILSIDEPTLSVALDDLSSPAGPTAEDWVKSDISPVLSPRPAISRRLRSKSSILGTGTLEEPMPAETLPESQISSSRRSSRNRNLRLSGSSFETEPSSLRWTKENPNWASNWRVPLTYFRTTVDKDDVARLDEGEFLNDNLINFYIQYLQTTLQKERPELAKRIYIHNTFFYEKLKPKKGKAIAFDGVRRWTAKVDLFSYDYIIVPVNEFSHWWVAILSNVPKFVEASTPTKSESSVTILDGDQPKQNVASNAGNDALNSGSSAESVNSLRMTDVSTSKRGTYGDDRPVNWDGQDTKNPTPDIIIDVDEGAKSKAAKADAPVSVRGVDVSDDEVTEIKSDAIAQPAPTPPRRKLPKNQARKTFTRNTKTQNPKDPRIITLDSLGSPHGISIDHLKQWMLAEIEERKHFKPVDPGRLGMTAKTIPQQENFCDCGVYLLLYIQEFIREPDSFICDIILRNERKWNMSAPDMRNTLRSLIMDMQREYQGTEESKRKRKSDTQKRETKTPPRETGEQLVVRETPPNKRMREAPAPLSSPCVPVSALQEHSSSSAAKQNSPTSPFVRANGRMSFDEGGDSAHSRIMKDSTAAAAALETPRDGSSPSSPIGPAEAGFTSPFGEESPSMSEHEQ